MFGCFEMQGQEMSFVISVHFNDRKSSFMIKTISNTKESKRTSFVVLSSPFFASLAAAVYLLQRFAPLSLQPCFALGADTDQFCSVLLRF